MKRIILFIFAFIVFILTIVYGILNNLIIEELQTYHYVLAGVVVFFSLSLALFINFRRARKVKTLEMRLKAWSSLSYFVNKVGDEAFTALPIGILIYEKDTFTVKWGNNHAESIFNNTELEDALLDELHPEFENLINSSKNLELITIDEKIYDVHNSKTNQVLYLFDVTNREEIRQKYDDRQPALGMLYLDNVEEALQSYDVYEKTNIKAEYLGAITDFVNQHKGFLRLYTEDKMVIAFDQSQLRKIMENKFEVLTQIREISNKHRIRVSASIGIACWDVSYEELNDLAQNAIELAEKRGGDQAVVNIEGEKIAYFGGKSDASEKSSRVQVRVHAQTFKELVESSEKVIIMAHRHADIDAFGAMIGVSKMAAISEVPYYMISQKNDCDDTVKKVIDSYRKEVSEYDKHIISAQEAIDKIDDETLLVVVDSQSPKIVASQELLEKASKVAVIDHHRHSEETFDVAQFMYVEPYASSSVELIAEMMEFYHEDLEIEPIEASIMYGGILVDTNEFLYRTGTRTFAAAAYLKEFGASVSQVKEWLRISKEQMIELNTLLALVVPIIDGFGVVVDSSDEIRDRVTIAKVSEKILDIDGYTAGFTIAKIGENNIGISARSYGSINVQVIMEELGGGGHLNSAAAQISDKTPTEVYDLLKSILIREMDEGDEVMKIILLEAIKSKGEKDDIIDVPNGYGQYLISTKKAILATPEAVKALEEKKEHEEEVRKQHHLVMEKLKEEIEAHSVNVYIKIGQDGKLYGRITPKMVQEAFKEQNGIEFDRKKLVLTSEINSIGIYTAAVHLSPDVRAHFEINVLEE